MVVLQHDRHSRAEADKGIKEIFIFFNVFQSFDLFVPVSMAGCPSSHRLSHKVYSVSFTCHQHGSLSCVTSTDHESDSSWLDMSSRALQITISFSQLCKYKCACPPQCPNNWCWIVYVILAIQQE